MVVVDVLVVLEVVLLVVVSGTVVVVELVVLDVVVDDVGAVVVVSASESLRIRPGNEVGSRNAPASTPVGGDPHELPPDLGGEAAAR